MTWYKKLTTDFFSSHILSTKGDREKAEQAFEAALLAMGPRSYNAFVASLLREVPPGVCAWALEDKEYTAAEMIVHLEESTPEGEQFAKDLLRVSSDLIVRAAQS